MLGFTLWKMDISIQKINSCTSINYEMIIAEFSVQKKLGKVLLFEETFLVSDTSIKVVLEMPFLTFSDVDTRFAEKELE